MEREVEGIDGLKWLQYTFRSGYSSGMHLKQHASYTGQHKDHMLVVVYIYLVLDTALIRNLIRHNGFT